MPHRLPESGGKSKALKMPEKHITQKQRNSPCTPPKQNKTGAGQTHAGLKSLHHQVRR
jgi:hypothetical protein